MIRKFRNSVTVLRSKFYMAMDWEGARQERSPCPKIQNIKNSTEICSSPYEQAKSYT